MCLNFKRTNIVLMIMRGVIKTCGDEIKKTENWGNTPWNTIKTKEMQIISLNLHSVLLFLHNSKLAISFCLMNNIKAQPEMLCI